MFGVRCVKVGSRAYHVLQCDTRQQDCQVLHWNRVPFGLSALVTPVSLHICPYFAYSHLLSPGWRRARLTGSHLAIRPHMGRDAPARWSTGALHWLEVIYLAERNLARSIPVLSFLSFSILSFDLTPISAVLLQELTHHCQQERAQVSPQCTLASSLSARRYTPPEMVSATSLIIVFLW